MNFILIAFLIFAGCSDKKEQVTFRLLNDYTRSFLKSHSEFSSITYKHFKIYFGHDSYSSANQSEIKKKLDEAFSRILEVLGLDVYPYGIYLVVVDSEERMKDLIGTHVKGFASLGNDLAFFVYNDSIRPYFKHEIFHLISSELWGRASSRMLKEGGAVYTDGECLYNDAIPQINSYMYRTNKFYPLTGLINNFNELAHKNDLAVYLQSASVFQFLYENYGLEKIRLLWKNGFTEFNRIFNMDLNQFESQWLKYVSEIVPKENIDWETLMNEGCG